MYLKCLNKLISNQQEFLYYIKLEFFFLFQLPKNKVSISFLVQFFYLFLSICVDQSLAVIIVPVHFKSTQTCSFDAEIMQCFKHGPTPAFLCLFSFFSNHLAETKLRDSNLDRTNRRHVQWPLYYSRGNIFLKIITLRRVPIAH